MGQVRVALLSFLIAVTLAGCGGSSNSPAFKDVSEVYAALVNRLKSQDKVLHAKMTSTPLDSSDQSTFDFWIDEARNLARKDEDIANVFPKDRKLLVVDGSAYSYVGNGKPTHWAAPNCEGISAPATSLLLGCQGVAGAHSELMNDGGKTLRIVTTGSYGPDIDNKPWSITLTLDADSLMPISGESDLWGILNGAPDEIRDTSTYTTEFVERDTLPTDFFDVKTTLPVPSPTQHSLLSTSTSLFLRTRGIKHWP